MRRTVYKNAANAIVFFRVLLVFCVMALLSAPGVTLRIVGVVLLVAAALLDWVDGYVAHTLKISSRVGGLLDTMGDRITENLLFIFFACQGIVPLYVPLFYVPRSFLADMIRTLSYSSGLATFEVNTSTLGRWLVASPVSRVLYLAMKIGIFLAAGALMVLQVASADTLVWIPVVQEVVWSLCGVTVAFSALRLVLLGYDSRAILKREFCA